MDIEKIVYINLDKRQDRRDKIELALSELEIPFERFAAIRPTMEEVHGKYSDIYDRCTHRMKMEKKFIQGRIGCYLSHKGIIENNIGCKKPILILEDDVSIKKEDLDRFLDRASLLPEDWDVFRVPWKYTLKTRRDFLRENQRLKRIEKVQDYIFRAHVPRATMGGSHFVLCRNFEKINQILDKSTVIEADMAYTTEGINSYLTRLVNMKILRMGSDIAGPKK